jgi:hypothetical protein
VPAKRKTGFCANCGPNKYFFHKSAQNFDVFSNIQEWNKKNKKTYSGCWPFQGLSNGTTFMYIQSGRTVPLSFYIHPFYSNYSLSFSHSLSLSVSPPLQYYLQIYLVGTNCVCVGTLWYN